MDERFDDPRDSKKTNLVRRPGRNRLEDIIEDQELSPVKCLPKELQQTMEKIKTEGFSQMAEDNGFQEWMNRKIEEITAKFKRLESNIEIVNKEKHSLEQQLFTLESDKRAIENKAYDHGREVGLRFGWENASAEHEPKIESARKEAKKWKIAFCVAVCVATVVILVLLSLLFSQLIA